MAWFLLDLLGKRLLNGVKRERQRREDVGVCARPLKAGVGVDVLRELGVEELVATLGAKVDFRKTVWLTNELEVGGCC